jgi:aspartyl-tRNA(Asn)/glutamyl-tRNA(Gln) amidotransferase subunit A
MDVIEEAKKINEKFNLFVTINETREKGFPVAIKDSICTRGLRTTAGSKILYNYIPIFDATVVKRIKEGGGNVIAKTSMDEFGFGGFCVNVGVDFKVPKNPWDPKRCCGGSSGGSGAYPAISEHPKFTIGESTGGSISSPANFCGVVGLTPTYGLVSRYGLIDYANSLDKIGVFARTVENMAYGLSIIAGHDSNDSTSLKEEPKDYTKFCREGKMKIGIPKEYFEDVIDDKVKKCVWKAIKTLESLGFEYSECSLPHTKWGVPAYYVLALSEASTNLAKFCGLRYGLSSDPEGKGFNDYFSEIRAQGFGAEAKRRIILGTFARMAGYRDAFYLKALKVRTLIIEDYKKAFKKFDVLISPVMPTIAPTFEDLKEMTPIQHYMADILTNPPNLAGIPHLSVPCGSVDGMPVGMHILGDHLREDKIIQAAYNYEKERGEINYPKV